MRRVEAVITRTSGLSLRLVKQRDLSRGFLRGRWSLREDRLSPPFRQKRSRHAGEQKTQRRVPRLNGEAHDIGRFPRLEVKGRGDPATIDPAIEEFLDPRASRDAGRRRDPRRRASILVLASANRDPDRSPDAERPDFERAPNPHLAFGGGRHFCIGAHLGRLEGRVAIRAAIDRLQPLRPLVESIEYRPNFLFRVPESVPVSLA